MRAVRNLSRDPTSWRHGHWGKILKTIFSNKLSTAETKIIPKNFIIILHNFLHQIIKLSKRKPKIQKNQRNVTRDSEQSIYAGTQRRTHRARV